jgi:nitroreductase
MPKTLSLFSVYDLGMLTQNILLGAEDAGIASLIATAIVSQPDILRKELEIPDDLSIVEGIALGYANKKSIINTYRSTRRPINEVARLKGF